MKDWFTIDKIDDTTYIISEYRELKAQGKLYHGAGTFDRVDQSVRL